MTVVLVNINNINLTAYHNQGCMQKFIEGVTTMTYYKFPGTVSVKIFLEIAHRYIMG